MSFWMKNCCNFFAKNANLIFFFYTMPLQQSMNHWTVKAFRTQNNSLVRNHLRCATINNIRIQEITSICLSFYAVLTIFSCKMHSVLMICMDCRCIFNLLMDWQCKWFAFNSSTSTHIFRHTQWPNVCARTSVHCRKCWFRGKWAFFFDHDYFAIESKSQNNF